MRNPDLEVTLSTSQESDSEWIRQQTMPPLNKETANQTITRTPSDSTGRLIHQISSSDSLCSDTSSIGSTTLVGRLLSFNLRGRKSQEIEHPKRCNNPVGNIDTRDISPTEITSFSVDSFKECTSDAELKPDTDSSSAQSSGWRMLRWWLCGVLLPVGFIAWLYTNSLFVVIGSILSMPLLAVFQGSMAILRYRLHYGDCPLPKAPSHGVVRFKHDGIVASASDCKNDTLLKERECPKVDSNPLRLLVIGDSLAIGVGQSKSSTPVMPETIATELSKEMGGRHILWTCHGAPGASAGWIVRELEHCVKQGKFQQFTEDTSSNDLDVNSTINDLVMGENNTMRTVPPSGRIVPRNSESDLTLDDSPDKVSHEDQDRYTWQEQLQKERIHFDPTNIGPFDIAVVLTGSNDLKSAFFPFLLSGEDAKFRKEAQLRGGGYGNELTRILIALNQGMRSRFKTLGASVEGATLKVRQRIGSAERMTQHQFDPLFNRRGDDSHHDTTVTENHDDVVQCHATPLFPMVVLPGMPARALPIFSVAPLRWLAVPVVDIMDNHKRGLAGRYPGEVLFVEAPTVRQITEFVDEGGEYWGQEEQEEQKDVFLRIRDIERHHARQINSEMKQYYNGRNKTSKAPSVHDRHFKIFSVDGIHPNDNGYMFWGQHIAHHIARELKVKSLANQGIHR